MDAPLDIKTNRSKSTSSNFRLLLTSVFLDRLAFYGLRNVVVFYAIYNLDINREEVLYYYGFYLLVSSLASFVGGLISDFLTGPKPTMIIGITLCLVGGTLSLIENPSTFLASMLLLLIGTGFFRASSFSFIGHISINQQILLEKRFILHYAAINLGAFLSALTVGMIGIYIGYFFSLAVVCILYVFSLIPISLLRNTNHTSPPNEKVYPEVVQSRSNIKFVVFAIIGAGFFWLMFEFYGYTRNYYTVTDDITLFGFQLPQSLFYLIPSLFTILLIIPYYFFANRLSITFKIALGLLLLAVLWIIWVLFLSSNILSLGLIAVLTIGFTEAILDLFVTPTMMTFICRYLPKRIYGTLFGIYSLLCFAGVKLGTFLSGEEISMTVKIILGVALIGVAIYFLLLPNEFTTEKADPVERLEEI